ncbi:hypothetical protein [Flavobacterium sp. WC2509]|uniref:hypothetical protein n=1 Tax=Flavobacterium sp. WC2509 TaxID=3461406 RepID=UPI0040441095
MILNPFFPSRSAYFVHCKSISVSENDSVGSIALLSSFTNPFKFSSKAFLARMLERDKAENLGSLLGGFENAGFTIGVFSSTNAIGFAISFFSMLLSLISFLETSTIE